MSYGDAPEVFRKDYRPVWDEYMHWLYLPVVIDAGWVTVPDNLEFLWKAVLDARYNERELGNEWEYVYLTARRGYATPSNPINRPGWHSDGFGTPDVNYIWSDRWPTRFATGIFTDISDDHIESAQQFQEQIDHSGSLRVFDGDPFTIYRLTQDVVHSTPLIPEDQGGDRSFFKISFSNSKFNLKGNSHNYGLQYDWKMWDRSEVRNDPAYAGGDSAPS